MVIAAAAAAELAWERELISRDKRFPWEFDFY